MVEPTPTPTSGESERPKAITRTAFLTKNQEYISAGATNEETGHAVESVEVYHNED